MIQSFKNALKGLHFMIKTQRNGKWHLIASLLVLGMAAYYQVDPFEWLMLVVAMGMVWSAEAMNTAIETLADKVHPKKHPMIGQAKDVAAGAVLAVVISAVFVGAIIFGPYLIGVFK